MRGHLVAVVALALTLGGAACAAPQPSSSVPGRSASTGGASASRTAPATTSPPRSSTRMERAVREVAADHPEADVAMAFAPVGAASEVRMVGPSTVLVAWSTIKVPLALAVIRTGAAADAAPDIHAALTASDNAAAGRLWQRLGSGERAASAVEVQLRRGGDRRTQVPPEVSVAGFSPFGQAKWALRDQTRFTAALPCLGGSSRVTDAMGRVVASQRWGLGSLDGARFKGGWGSTPDGYVVRQMGLVPGAKGETAVTLQVRAGTYEEGTAIADELAAVVRSHRRWLPVGECT